MTLKTKAQLLLVRALFLGALFFASWTASMYLPHSNPWWHVATGILLAVILFTTIQSYRRRTQQNQQSAPQQHGI